MHHRLHVTHLHLTVHGVLVHVHLHLLPRLLCTSPPLHLIFTCLLISVLLLKGLLLTNTENIKSPERSAISSLLVLEIKF